MAKEELIRPNPSDLELIKKLEDLLEDKLEQILEIKSNNSGYIVNESGLYVFSKSETKSRLN